MNQPAAAQWDDSLGNYWPQDVSHEATLRIGEVIKHLSGDFPFLAHSKVRYFESLGLIAPERTDSNQRLFSIADVERLRFILEQQRDKYLRLPQIKELLRQLDSGQVVREHAGRMRVLPDNDSTAARPAPGTRVRKDELSALTGVPLSSIERYISAGLLVTDSRGRLTAQAVDIVRYAQLLEQEGNDLRIARLVRNSAHSHAISITNALATSRARKSPVARERAINEAGEMATMLTQLYRALLLEKLEEQMR
ncbi:MAG: MerR family transcriptional regulator [Trueperella sp.]|nr:MerR family transcriptional regulator [Trueperella sp.]